MYEELLRIRKWVKFIISLPYEMQLDIVMIKSDAMTR